MESVFGEIASTIILSLPEEIRPDESPVECTIRLLKDYAQLKDQLEPMSLRLAAAEKELELIKGKGDGAPAKTE
jgi:hypothetical protein